MVGHYVPSPRLTVIPVSGRTFANRPNNNARETTFHRNQDTRRQIPINMK